MKTRPTPSLVARGGERGTRDRSQDRMAAIAPLPQGTELTCSHSVESCWAHNPSQPPTALKASAFIPTFLVKDTGTQRHYMLAEVMSSSAAELGFRPSAITQHPLGWASSPGPAGSFQGRALLEYSAQNSCFD